MKLSDHTKSNILLSIIMLSIPISFVYFYITQEWQWFLYSVISSQISKNLGSNIGAHRYFTHKSFETGRLRHMLLALFSIPMAITPIKYAMNHRHHHLFADQQGKDTHSPQENLWSVVFATWEFNNYEWFHNRGVTMRCRDLLRDPVLMWIERNFYRVWTVLIVITLLINWKICLFILLLPAGWYHLSAGLVNAIGHYKIPGSYRNYTTEDHSYNHWLWGIITVGEGFHNNHHAKPNSACFGKHWWEFDITWWVIKYCFATNKVKSEH